MKKIEITARAFDDLAEIENYSIKTWGQKIADKYLDDIAVGIKLLQENSGLLQEFEEFSANLKYYRVKNHFLSVLKLKNIFLKLLKLKLRLMLKQYILNL